MVMNEAFRAAAQQVRQRPVQLTPNQEVCRLYRKALKTLGSWAIDREVFIEEATKLRARFDSNRGCSSAAAARLLGEGKEELYQFTHPDPYCVPWMPGGSLFMRNPPLPMDICFPDGDYPEDAPKVTLNPDMSVCKPETGKSAVGTVLVDFTKKNME
uniref:NADH dehydrogenase [ubiquinone] 1 beta subcomplex subunit 9 n=1 Tax=Trieres chinensis TaxID=1514140 RepID=A0A7S2EN98_TRICV|mmetsp:Transcript_31930/g.65200  ORF Transcript_31930/g.65200 Transcript_31930/m.65200 type:complete len:157 (+) Transcript_31930:115-585(+)|eukprot:CAMPEP_0183292754 /NCGR_PEP_ID=MMETSP0160_2-20130417/1697_1 /TAXON_ID=2839 ORGANISM="Odontella Sinensis, Strain Grunow 1884" /NCGR_SAMPLE_ID=MMETSP0160_2 /ASSEMBLY_ACC=CAM_ASM_000250 /LENGTH=156 /DNA_ID=CAMNT_0025453759 /DNA_START=68 /DNA_END=538 /DNA_ORIENTATION=+